MHRTDQPENRRFTPSRSALGARILRFAPRLIIAASLFLIVDPASASEHDPNLVGALSHFHQDPSDEVLDAFEPGLLESLLAIIDDDQVPRLARLRAINALGRYPTLDPVLERLGTIALDTEGDVRLRLAAVGTLGYRLGERPETIEVLGRVLGDPDPGVRVRAVNALSHVGGARAEELLSSHRMIEMHVLVRRALRAALESRLGAPLPPEGRLRPEIRSRVELQPGADPTAASRAEEEPR